jgi:serine/threonine protein kinase
MGRVYLGRSPGGRHVAIKVIRADLAENPDFRARFAREASAARKVSGIFTAPVVDADLTGPVPWLATSYIAGPSLGDAVAERGPMPSALVLRLAAGLAEGLAAIHSAGVVHRDLKPSNVLLAEDGPRLIDFGISRSVESSMLTRTGMVVGSPGFMSPEQAEGRPVGPPSDIFSLGAVLTFAATGEGPFGEGSTVALLFRVVASEPNTQGMPHELRVVVERCLTKDPLQRPTAAALLAQLSTAEVVADPAREGTTRKSAALPGSVRQQPAAAAGAIGAAGAMGAAGAVGAAAAAPVNAYPATQQAPTPPPRQADTPEYMPTLGPSGVQHVYDERATAGERPWSGPTSAPQPYPPTPAPQPQAYQPPYPPAPPPQPQAYQPPPQPQSYQQPYQPGAPPPRRRSRRRPWPIAAAAAVVVLVAVAAVAFLAGRSKPHPNNPGAVNAAQSSAAASQPASSAPASSAPASSPSATSTQLPGAAAMSTLASYLARSAGVRPTVQAAINGVQSCSESPASGEATIQQAINTRQDILQGLQTLDVTGLPNGTQLVSAFRTAMQNSLKADNDYHAWMADLVSSGNACGSNPNQDSNYTAAGTADTASTSSKDAFLAIWNPMAPRYGQQTYTDTGF